MTQFWLDSERDWVFHTRELNLVIYSPKNVAIRDASFQNHRHDSLYTLRANGADYGHYETPEAAKAAAKLLGLLGHRA